MSIKKRSSGAAIAGSLLLAFCGAAYPATVVSYIDTVGPKEKMIVDGKPFFYNAIQTSFFRLTGMGFTNPQLESVIKTAKQEGFTVIGNVVSWKDVEPTQGNYTWAKLDSLITWCVRQGIHMDIIWFGHDVCTYGGFAPSWVVSGFQKVLSQDGSNYNKLDKTDTTMRAAEALTVGTMMNHIRTYIDSKSYPNIIVGIQYLNESTVTMLEDWSVPTPRSYSKYANAKWTAGGYTDVLTFNADVMLEYLNAGCKAIKQSNYPVWTRHNWAGNVGWGRETDLAMTLIDKNEAMKKRGASYFDFAGGDIYSSDLTEIFGYSTTWNKGHNLSMIMENGADDPNLATNIFVGLAGGTVSQFWELHDDNQGAGGLYHINSDHTLSPSEPSATDTRNMNLMLVKNWYNLASLKPGTNDLRFFNGGTPNSGSQVVGGYSVGCASGPGIVSARDGDLVFLCTTQQNFTVPATISAASLDKGFYDSTNTWISQGTVTATISGSQKSFPVGAYECVRLRTSGATIAGGFAGRQPAVRPRPAAGADVNCISLDGRVMIRGKTNANGVVQGQLHSGVYLIQAVAAKGHFERDVSKVVVE